jgi:hypothetical protein
MIVCQKLPNDKIFRENRHDQSILSLILKVEAESHDFTFHEDDTYETIWNAAGLSGVLLANNKHKFGILMVKNTQFGQQEMVRVDFTNCRV